MSSPRRPQPASGLEETAAPDPALDATAAPSLALDQTAASNPALDRTAEAGPSTAPSRGGRGVAEVGTRIGRFVVLGKLGEGGMGLVLSAYDPDLDRKVAVKLLRADPHADDGGSAATERRERLLREARAMAKLSHPNVVAVHEVGTEGDQIFIAMEFAGGGTLRTWVAAAERPWRELLARFVDAGRGLEAAHRSGLVHRDFKPDNVLLTADGLVRVADFGLVGGLGDVQVRAIPSTNATGDATTMPLTMTGSIMGTPAYMAPEQFRGDKAGPAADQFALCVALWEVLYRERPFSGKSYAELATAVTTGARVAPSDDRGVPSWIRGALERGLAVDPAARWPSIGELLAILTSDPDADRRRRQARIAIGVGAPALVAAAVTAGVLLAGGGGPSQRCAGFERRLDGIWDSDRRAALAAAFTATGAPFAAPVIALTGDRLDAYATGWVDLRRDVCQATHERGEQSEAALDLRMGCLDRRLTELDALVDVLSGSPDVEAVSRSVAAVAGLIPLDRCTDVAALGAAVPLPEDPATVRDVADARGELATIQAMNGAGAYREALARARSLADRARAIGYAPLRAEALYLLAVLHDRTGDSEAAPAVLYEAAEAAAEGRDHAVAAATWTFVLKVVGDRLARFAEAEQAVHMAGAALALAGRPIAAAAQLHNEIGSLRGRQGRHLDALLEYQATLALRLAIVGGDVGIADALNNLASTLDDLERPEEAIEIYQGAITIYERSLGGQHPDVARTLSSLGAILVKVERVDEGVEALERALAIQEAALGSSHPLLAFTWNNLGNAHVHRGDFEAALAGYRRAQEIAISVLGPQHPDVADPMIGEAGALYTAGRGEEALIVIARARVILAASFDEVHPRLLQVDALAGEILSDLGRHAEALVLFRVSLAAAEHGNPVIHTMVGDRLNNIGRELNALGDLGGSVETYRRASTAYAREPGKEEMSGAMLSIAGGLLVQLDRLDEAERDLAAAIALLEQVTPVPSDLGYAWRDRAALETKRKHLAAAVDAATRALVAFENYPTEVGVSQYTLAEALWAEGKDRARAVELVQAAHADFTARGADWVEQRDEAARWLATHRAS